MDDDDTVEIFELKAPVWEFKFGKLLGEFVSFVIVAFIPHMMYIPPIIHSTSETQMCLVFLAQLLEHKRLAL